MKLRVLSLFAGIGGFDLGLERTGGFQTVAFCEIEPFCQKVLAKHWPKVPIYNDVRNLTAERLRSDGIGAVDVVCGGYPCQPFSTAGRRAGDQDDRHLWPEVHRLLDELRPTWFIGENVSGHISLGLDEVLSDLEGINYSARPFVIPACAVDAPHRRDRVWIIGNANTDSEPVGAVNDETSRLRAMGNSIGITERPTQSREFPMGGDAIYPNGWEQGSDVTSGSGADVANTSSQRQSGQGQPIQRGSSAPRREGQADSPFAIRFNGKWPTEPNVGRVAYGIPARMDRLKSLGNAVVPQIPELIGRAILEAA